MKILTTQSNNTPKKKKDEMSLLTTPKNFLAEVLRTRQNISARHIPALVGTTVILAVAGAVYHPEELGGK